MVEYKRIIKMHLKKTNSCKVIPSTLNLSKGHLESLTVVPHIPIHVRSPYCLVLGRILLQVLIKRL